jgi:hypothetical protein
MLYGEWPTGEPRAKIEHNILLAIEYIAAPEEPEPSQPFQIIGTMSGMISRRYNDLTAPQGAIDKLTPSTEPGSLGIAIPPDYKGKHLPLWRFTQQPSGLPTKEG